MRQRKWVIAAMSVLLVALAPADAARAGDRDNDKKNEKKQSYIVVLVDSIAQDPGQVADEHARDGDGGQSEVKHVYRYALKGYSMDMTAKKAAKVAQDPRVDFVELDKPYAATAQTIPTGIDRIQADASSQQAGNGSGSVNVGVAVIDTGIDLDHPDLNVVGGRNCIVSVLSADDDNGHGSHVAGTIAARDDANGVVGVAPGARLYAVKVLTAAGVGLGSWIICGIDWVAQNSVSLGIKVANMSLGGSGTDDRNCGNTNNDAEHKAICNVVARGVTFVVAAGNDNLNLASTAPAAYDEVLTVSAMADFNGAPGGGGAATCTSDVDDTSAGYSNWTTIGSLDAGHTIAAPGSCIRSTYSNGGYSTISGTSMATPHVAGTVALCIASGACAGMAPAQVISRIRSDAAAQAPTYGFLDDPHTPLGNRWYGHLVHAASY